MLLKFHKISSFRSIRELVTHWLRNNSHQNQLTHSVTLMVEVLNILIHKSEILKFNFAKIYPLSILDNLHQFSPVSYDK